MFDSKRKFSMFLGTCYLWVIFSQFFLNCPCVGKEKNSEPTEISSCCPSDSTPSCCESEEQIPSGKTSDESGLGECCQSESVCSHCPHCLAQNLVVPADNSPRIILSYPITSVAINQDDLSFSADSSPVVDRPPDRLPLAIHISTTVLRI